LIGQKISRDIKQTAGNTSDCFLLSWLQGGILEKSNYYSVAVILRFQSSKGAS